MPVKPIVIKRMDAWSYSRYNDYRKCPAYACYKHVQKIREPGSPALDRGSAIHALAEKFAKAKKGTKTPAELATFAAEFKQLQATKVLVEEQWAFTDKWEPTGWFDKGPAGAYSRMVVDCCYMDIKRNVLVVIDHKTGKINPDHAGQLSLYALGGLLQYPACAGVEVQLWYLDHGVQVPETPKVYQRDELPALKKEWATKVKKMMADTRFAPTPSKSCGWCFYSKAKNGPCQY